MKKKTIAGLIAIVVIASVVIFAGCIEKEEVAPSAPTSTPLAPTTTPEASSTEPSVTETPTPITTPSSLFGKKPDPYFPSPNYAVDIYYEPYRGPVRTIVSIEIANRGGEGEVFVIATWVEGGLTNSKVLYMDKGEKAKLRAYFKGEATGKIEWTTRPALPSDSSHGEIQIERSNIEEVTKQENLAVKGKVIKVFSARLGKEEEAYLVISVKADTLIHKEGEEKPPQTPAPIWLLRISEDKKGLFEGVKPGDNIVAYGTRKGEARILDVIGKGLGELAK